MDTHYYEIKIDKYEIGDDGSLLIKDVKLMAEGTWHASNAWRPVRYGKTVLKKYAKKWTDNSIWSRHGASERSITNLVGEVKNPRYQDNAVMGDIYLHGKTPESVSSITLIRNKYITDVSSEVAMLESNYCDKLDVDNAKQIAFVGLALVSNGACSVCKLNAKNTNNLGDENMDEKEFTEKLEKLEQSVTDMTLKFEALVIPEAVDMKPIQEALDALKTGAETYGKFEDRIVKLEKTPITVTLDNSTKEVKKVFNPFE